MPRAINDGEAGESINSGNIVASNILSKSSSHSGSSQSSSPLPKNANGSNSTKKPQNNSTCSDLSSNNCVNKSSANGSANDDMAFTDEIKVYKDEGVADEEQSSSENLNEIKIGLVNETEEEKTSVLSHPFSVNNMLYSNSDNLASNAAAAAAAAAAHFGLSRNLYSPLYSRDFAQLASWWPATASLYNPLSNPHTFPFSSPFSAANYSAQQVAAAAFSGFNNPFFLPPPSSLANVNSNGVNNNSLKHENHQIPSNINLASIHNHNRANFTSNNPNSIQLFDTPTKISHQKQEPDQNNSSNGFNQNLNRSNQQAQNKMQSSKSHNINRNNGSSINTVNEIDSKPKKPHIKKPLNAFMLFMKEQRSKVVSECTLRESAAINQILGRKWHELDRADQAKYYEMARQERLKHMQLYPGWSARDNYGLKKKRRRKREKVIGENGELPRKCRARYGLHQINLWCKPCRRKKKCIRFTNQDETNHNNLTITNMGQNINLPMNYSEYNIANMTNNTSNGILSCGSVGDASSGGIGSGSLNGGNSDDEYEDYDALEDEDDDDCDDLEDFEESEDSDTENKANTTLLSANKTIGNSNNTISANGNLVVQPKTTGQVSINQNNSNILNLNLMNNNLNVHSILN